MTQATITADSDVAETEDAGDRRESRFFLNLLLSAGIAAGAVVGFGVVWDDADLGITAPAAQQADILAPHP